MTSIVVQHRRTGWDIFFGILLVLAGFVVLGDVVFATVISVLLIGWITLAAGIVGIVAALFRIGKPGFLSAILSGGLLTALGIVFVRNPGLLALTLTLLAGFAFLVSGIVRIAAGLENSSARWVLFISGLASLALGIIVLTHITTATLTLLGTLLGIQIVFDGITMIMVGRVRVKATSAEPVGVAGAGSVSVASS